MQRRDLAARLAAEGLRGLPWDGRQRLLLPVPLPPHTGQKVPLPSLQGKEGSAQTASGPSRTRQRPKTTSAPSPPVSPSTTGSLLLPAQPCPTAHAPRVHGALHLRPPPITPTLHPSPGWQVPRAPSEHCLPSGVFSPRSAWRLPVILDSA